MTTAPAVKISEEGGVPNEAHGSGNDTIYDKRAASHGAFAASHYDPGQILCGTHHGSGGNAFAFVIMGTFGAVRRRLFIYPVYLPKRISSESRRRFPSLTAQGCTGSLAQDKRFFKKDSDILIKR